MPFLRYLSVVLLAVWVGGLTAMGIAVAPAIFSTLEAYDPAAGRTLAGIAFGAVFTEFQHVAWIVGLLLLAVLGVRAALGPRPRRFGVRMWTLAAMLGMSLASGLVIAPRIDRIRGSTAGTIAALADTDARKIEFGRLHGLSNGLMVVTIVAGLWLLWADLRDVI